MTKKERWLTTIAFAVSVLPALLMAFMLKTLPSSIPLFDMTVPNTEPTSKYNSLITIIFCVIPMIIVLVARYIKKKISNYRNYTAILFVAMALSISFTGITLNGFLIQLRAIPGTSTFDYLGIVAVVLSILTAIMGNWTRYRKYKKLLAINNKYTRSNPTIWKTVHNFSAFVQVIGFVLTAIALAFINGWYSLLTYGIMLALFCVFTYAYSYFVKGLYDERKNSELENYEKN